MPSSSLVQAAIFAAGAIVGGGVTAVVTSKRQRPAETVSSSQAAISTISPPVVGLGSKGNAELSSAVSLAPLATSVLKYGNPGE